MGNLFSLSKHATEVSLDVSEWALLVFGILLVVGLVGEFKEPWKSRRAELAALFVIIGVAGELFADGGIFLFSRHLQAIADEEVAGLTKEAGDAKTSAELAAKAAGRAKEESDNAKASASTALRFARSSGQETEAIRAGQLLLKDEQHSLSETLKTTAGEQKQLNDFLMRRVMPRQFRGDMAVRLKSLPPGNVDIWYRAEDPEAWMFSLSVETALYAAGWKNVRKVAIDPQRFNGEKAGLPIGGCAIVSKDTQGFFPIPPQDVEFTTRMIGASSGKKVDERVVILAIGLGTGYFEADPTLDAGAFRIIIGPRLIPED